MKHSELRHQPRHVNPRIQAVVGNVVGGAIAGPAGALVGTGLGFNGYKKVTIVCNKCGRVFVKRV